MTRKASSNCKRICMMIYVIRDFVPSLAGPRPSLCSCMQVCGKAGPNKPKVNPHVSRSRTATNCQHLRPAAQDAYHRHNCKTSCCFITAAGGINPSARPWEVGSVFGVSSVHAILPSSRFFLLVIRKPCLCMRHVSGTWSYSLL